MRKSPSIPTILNKNVSYIDSPASWVFYTFLWLAFRVILAGLGLSAETSWAIVNWIHGIISYVLFHWIMGTPFASDHEHESDLLTFWEQIDDQVLYTRARKFLTLFPIALFVHFGRMIWDQVPMLDVMITVESDLVGLKWAFMSESAP